MKTKQRTIQYGPRFDSKSRAYRHVRWIENVSRGLRLAGFADELTRSVDNQGWFTSEFCEEVYRGIVYRMPHGRFAYGYADPDNDDCSVLCFDNDADTVEEAARYADQFAQLFAEREREYQAKWQAARRVEEARERIGELRETHTQLVTELRQERLTRAALKLAERPHICAHIRAELSRLRDQVHKARREIADVLSTYGDEILGPEYQ